MKKDLPSIIIRQCLILLIILINIVVLSYIVRNNNFFIDKDSYQFITPSVSDTYSMGKLGKNGLDMNIPFYNRIGYVSFIKAIDAVNFTSISLSRLVIYSNLLFISATSILIYFILFHITSRKKLSILGGVLFNFTSINVFVSSMVLNDSLAVFLLIFNFYLILKYKNIGVLNILIFSIISTLRVEYLLTLIPIYLTLKPHNKKLLFWVPITGLLTNIILLLPFIDSDFINRNFEILNNVKFDFIYLILFFTLILVCIKVYPKILKYLLGIFSVIIAIFLVLQGQLVLLVPTFLSLLVPVILLLILSIVEQFKPNLLNKSGEKYIRFFVVNTLLFFLFYKTFYFHHLVVLTPLISILSVLYLSRLNLPAYIYKFITNSYVKTYFIAGSLFVISWNLFVYKAFFYKYNYDLPQIVLNDVNGLIANEGITNTGLVIVSDFPEASFYWLNIPSQDKKNITQDYSLASKLIYISFDNKSPEFSSYELIKDWKLPVRLNYSYFQEEIGFNPKEVRVSLFEKKDQ